jgi:hypothetical protein
MARKEVNSPNGLNHVSRQGVTQLHGGYLQISCAPWKLLRSRIILEKKQDPFRKLPSTF